MPRWSLPQPLQAALTFFQPTTETISVVAGIQPVMSVLDQLWQQCLADENLETAKDWLLAQSREQDHSDTWDYVRHWALHSQPYSVRCTSARWMN